MKTLILFSIIMMATTSLVKADPITFEATVNSPHVSLDEALQLTLTITGVNENLDPVSLPVLDGFSAKYLGPSTRVSIVNGDYHSERSFIYNLFPNKIGHFQIPSITATIDGQTYATKPIDVDVAQNPSPAQPSGQPSDQNVPTTESLKDKVLMTVSVDKTDVYLDERVPVTIKLLVNGVPVRDIQYPQFDKTGFLVDDFKKPEQTSDVLNGVKYDTVVFKTSVYPNHLGDLSLGPVQIQGNIIYKTGQNNPFSQDGSFFGADVFNNFFDSYATRPVTVNAEPIHLHVSALPSEGRPNDFSGAIGQFDFQANVSPLQVKAGDPLTLKMDIKGNGNFKDFKMPPFNAGGFKSYEPKVKDTGDEKTAEEVIIPTSATVSEVPFLSFSYFDPSRREYKTITQGPFPIHVSAPSPDQEFKAMGFSDISRASALPATQFSFGEMFNDLCKILRKLSASLWFWVSVCIVFIAGLSYFLWRRFQKRLEHDPAFARRLKAVREARQALLPAEEYISGGRTKDFYALVSKVLRDYLANKWHESSPALSIPEIVNHLKSANVDKTQIGQIQILLEQADLVCFASANRDAAQMRADLTQTQELIAQLEKYLK